MRPQNILVWRVALAAWIGVIFFSSTSLALRLCEQSFNSLSSLLFKGLQSSDSSFGALQLVADKGLHVCLFFVLGLLLWKSLAATPPKPVLILVAGLIIGSCSEFLQRFFPDRDPAIHDVLINLCGTALGLLVARFALKEKPTEKSAVQDSETVLR